MKKYFQNYKKSITQIVGLTIGYLLFHKLILLYLSFTLLLILIFLPKLSLQITKYTDVLITYIGTVLKSILLSFMFFVIIIPISIVYNLKRQNKINNKTAISFFQQRESEFSAIGFKKMW